MDIQRNRERKRRDGMEEELEVGEIERERGEMQKMRDRRTRDGESEGQENKRWRERQIGLDDTRKTCQPTVICVLS